MKQIKFPYLKYIVTPPTQKPAQYVYRPVIPIELGLDNKTRPSELQITASPQCETPVGIDKRLKAEGAVGRDCRL